MSEKEIHNQNRKLVSKMENIQDAIQHKQSLTELNQMLNEIQNLFKTHCSAEEIKLVAQQDPQNAARLQDYSRILRNISSLKSFVISSSWPLALEYANIIKISILNHLTTFDEFINSHREQFEATA